MGEMMNVRRSLRDPRDPRLWAGQVAWGWRVSSEGALERDEHEENVVAVARHMRENGHTIREIVQFFRDMGVVGRRGKPICTTRVFEMIHGGRKKRRPSDGS